MILLVFALLFNICACVDLRYIGGEFGYSVKYLFIEILSSDKPKKKKKSVIKEYLENFAAVVDFVKSSMNDILGLTRKIKVSRVCVDCLVADEDAFSCAVNYGVLSAGVYNILAFISSYFTTDTAY